MSLSTYATMLLVPGIVWGGFAFLLMLALRKEAGKDATAE